MYKIKSLFFVLIIISSCTADPELKDTMTTYYPDLYNAVFDRDPNAILEFTNSEDEQTQKQAWKALISTPVPQNELSGLIDKVVVANTKEAWASLWFKDLSEAHITQLHELWNEKPEVRSGLVELLGYQGNRDSFELLLAEDAGNTNPQFDLALAIGRLSLQLDLTTDEQISLIQKALAEKSSKLTNAYLYGLYRGRKDIDSKAEQELLSLWDTYYPDDESGHQYIVRILMKNHMDKVLYYFPIEDYQTMNVQLAIEIAQGIARNEFTDYSTVILNALLNHKNPNVVIQALQAIKQNESAAQRLTRDILNKAGLTEIPEARIRVEALNTIPNPRSYTSLVYEIAGDNPYLQTIKYEVLEKTLSNGEFLELLMKDAQSENRLNRFFALRTLNGWWTDADEDFRDDAVIARMKEFMIDQMGTADRSMIYVMNGLFEDEQLFSDSEFELFENMLRRFQLPEDVEVYQSVSGILKNRYEDAAAGLIDSLASKGNVALNQALINQGWDIPQGDYYPAVFRTPSWNRLVRLGANPVLILETSKGDIYIRMDALSAPATISGMDELVREGAYNEVPFHRVVPNFVVQGGDVETQDGFGGPYYVVPTESSIDQYERGKVGIASAGTDTEGSQYFIMHQWAPHLNGRYTIVGEVIEGMDVVDRMVVGDIVKRAYWD